MGLDMYLKKVTYIGNEYRKPEQRLKIISPKKEEGVTFPIGNQIKEDRISSISENVAYWRKANQIHKWFVDNIQNREDDCREYYIDKEKLEELLNLCKKIKEKQLQPEESLPTQGGFFFGSTDYDEYYMQDIENTIEQLEPLLQEEGDFYYSSSW